MPAGVRSGGPVGRTPSVVVAAHDESAVITRCLDALAAQDEAAAVVVVANGCHDDTAGLARRPGVRVVELAEAGKANALNHGDAVAVGFPRLYLDADIVLPSDGVRRLADALAADDDLQAAVPARRMATEGRPWVVRCWAAINARLPVYEDALFGRGAIMLSRSGRALFEDFPGLMADDLFLDSVVARDRRAVIGSVEVVVQTPYRTRDLLNRLVRVRRANADLRSRALGTRPAARASWLRSVVLRDPRLLPAGLVYAVLTVVAAERARRASASKAWGRDESSRTAVGARGTTA
nr:glycosyltransferase family 2 protein [Microlunatus sagamiharensis]